MTKYRFYEDRKVSVWERIYFSIEAATIETAEAQAAAIAHRSLYAAACDDAAIENDPRDRSVRERGSCYGPNPQCRRRQLPDDRRQRSDIGNERNAKLN